MDNCLTSYYQFCVALSIFFCVEMNDLKPKLAAIVSRPMYQEMLDVKEKLEDYCALSPFLAEDNEHSARLYREIGGQYDACIFGGIVLLRSAIGEGEASLCPCYALSNGGDELRDIILRILLKNRNFDLSRIFVDAAMPGNGYLGMAHLIEPEQMPYTLSDLDSWPEWGLDGEFQWENIRGFDEAQRLTRQVLEMHLRLHREGKIGLSITRFGAIVSTLEGAGYPVLYLAPTREYISGFIMQVVNTLNMETVRAQMMSAMVLRPEQPMTGEVWNRAAAAVMNFSRIHGYDFSVLQEQDLMCILTRYKDMSALSEDFTSTAFVSGIFSDDMMPSAIGMGAGHTMFQAKQNALSALYLTKPEQKDIYYISEDNRITGPIGRAGISYTRLPSDEILGIAERYEVDHVQLQKIVSYVVLRDDVNVTAEDLAPQLEVTLRSASRLLSRIERRGGARVYLESSGKRGRPKKCYELHVLRAFCRGSRETVGEVSPLPV